MKLHDQVKFAVKALMSRKLRSSLTLLGILVGVVLLTSVFTMADSIAATTTKVLVRGGATHIFLMPHGFTLTDADRTQIESIPHVVSTVAYLQLGTLAVSSGGVKETASIIVVEPQGISLVYPGIEVEDGSLDITFRGCLIGSNLYQEFSNQGVKLSIGDLIHVHFGKRAIPLRVSGILERYGFSFAGGRIDDAVIVPMDLMYAVIGRGEYRFLLVVVDSVDHVDLVVDTLKDLYGENLDMFVVKDLVKQVLSAMDWVTMIVGSIASVALVVAAIGLMNAMFTAVAERTRIIGVLRALGARRRHILSIFILEASILGIIGVALGVVIGFAAGAFIVSFTRGLGMGMGGAPVGISVYLSPLHLAVSVLIPLALTILGALPPAYRASKLEPAQALRYE